MNEKTDIAVQDGPDPADLPALINGRRLLRWTAIVGVGIVAVLACWQDPLYAGGARSRCDQGTLVSVR